jgi:hypothetical protein
MMDEKAKVENHAGEPKESSRTRRRQRHHTKTKRKWYVSTAIVVGLLVAAMLVGLVIGYVGAGHGKWSEVFQVSTYKHIYDLVFQGT